MFIAAPSLQGEAISIRPAKREDIPVLANLLAQLYAAELPGALTGPIAPQSDLLRFTLEAQPTQALKNRYVLCGSDDRALATGMIQFPTEPPFDRAPAGTIQMAAKLLGYRDTGRLLLTVARSRIGVYSQRRTDTALLHSIVVNAERRKQGLGRLILSALERAVAEQGYRWVELQVLAGNESARRLYSQCGYQEIWRTPRWMAALSWSSCAMRKALK
ncbi:MAG: GNAT family N-acetyltransferase [Anaerolineales bacterium]|nr:GNAT family N-acetyltransferase [Anaerolineales bacterium]